MFEVEYNPSEKMLLMNSKKDLSRLSVLDCGEEISELVQEIGESFRSYLQKEIGSGVNVIGRMGALQTYFVETPSSSYFLNGDLEKFGEKMFCKVTIVPFKLEEDSFVRFIEGYGNFARTKSLENEGFN